MTLRNGPVATTLTAVAAVFGFLFLLAPLAHGPAGGRAIAGVIGAVLAVAAVRLGRVGLVIEPDRLVVRDLSVSQAVARDDVLGLALQHVARGRGRRVAVVLVDGRVIPAAWTLFSRTSMTAVEHAARAAAGFGDTQHEVADVLRRHGRMAEVEALPVATADPGLTPTTVTPADETAATRWLGWETVFVITAFALPGVADAVVTLARHVGGVSDLNDFATPLPHHQVASLVLLILSYSTTALVVPIALLLLARSGVRPSALGLSRDGWRRDSWRGVPLLAGVWVVNLVVLLSLHPILSNKHLTNTTSDSHVPADYVIYAVMLAATTAVNEEVLVNGYFLTRLSQLGYGRWAALAISLSVRTSYHVYYGVGLIATVPFGYLVTRSFQKRQRLVRPIVAHFLNDAVLLIVAVLTS